MSLEIPTSNNSTVTHIKVNGETCATWDLPKRFGFTYKQRQQTLETIESQLTHCTLGGVSLTLCAFEAEHPQITLGAE